MEEGRHLKLKIARTIRSIGAIKIKIVNGLKLIDPNAIDPKRRAPIDADQDEGISDVNGLNGKELIANVAKRNVIFDVNRGNTSTRLLDVTRLSKRFAQESQLKN